MTPEELKSGLKPVEDGIKTVLDAQGKIVGTVEELKVGALEFDKRFKSIEEMILDHERKLANKRAGGQYGGDLLLAAIPEADRKFVRHAEVLGRMNKACREKNPQAGQQSICDDDPVLKAAIGIWLRNHLWQLTEPAGRGRQVQEQQDKLTQVLSIEKAALGEDTAAIGGNLVPTIVESEILRLVVDNGIMRPLVRKIPMTVKTHAFPTRSAAFSAAIVAEAGTIADSAPASPFSQSNLTAKKLACFATVSAELLQDNVVGLGDYLAVEFAQQIARLEDTQALEGDGTGTNFTGVVAASGTNSVTSGANGDKTYWQKLIDTVYAATEQAAINTSAFFMATSEWKTLVKSRSDSITAADNAGLPLFAPAAGIAGRIPPSILGFPVYMHSGILTNRAVGTGTNRTNIYFGPPQTIIFGDLLGFSIDLNPWSKFASVQIDIRGIKRTGILVGVPSAWTKYTAIDPLLMMAP